MVGSDLPSRDKIAMWISIPSLVGFAIAGVNCEDIFMDFSIVEVDDKVGVEWLLLFA